MSDTPQAPDWWLASDGRWYPPTSLPGPGTAYTHASYGPPLGVSPVLAGWQQGLLWASAGFAVLMFILSLRALSILNDRTGGIVSYLEVSDAHDAYAAGMGFFLLMFFGTAVLTIIWAFKAHKTTDALYPIHRSWTAGWSIGGWFIPIANLVIPKLVLNETERIAFAPRPGGIVSPEWRQQSTSALGWAWWAFFVIGWLTFGVGTYAEETEAMLRSAESLRRTYILHAVSGLTYAVSGALGALYVRALSARLSPRALAESLAATE